MAWSDDAIRDSFLLSNAVPQNAALNSGKWLLLEKAVRKLAAATDFALVFTGPIFCRDDVRIGANQVAVPCQIFKVVVAGRGQVLHAFAAVLPNGYNPAEPLARFACSIAEVERRTGLDFLNALSKAEQAELESTTELLPGLEDTDPVSRKSRNLLLINTLPETILQRDYRLPLP
ncbi:MAG: DNA/RNA non-specific endonuclease [Bryobacteraceae bacterium]